MGKLAGCPSTISEGTYIINQAKTVNLDPGVLYETVIDLASEGLITSTAINMAAGILVSDLALPNYFFENITKESLRHILSSIAMSIQCQDGTVGLSGRVAHIDFNLEQGTNIQRVRIATEETRDSMEELLAPFLSGRRREYYYSPESKYYTYIIRPETVKDYQETAFEESKFLYHLAGNHKETPAVTRQRYESILRESETAISPLIEVFNLPETGETRLMFNSDFEMPQLPVLRRLFQDHDLILGRAYWEPYCGKSQAPSSICSLYTWGELSRKKETALLKDLYSYLALSITDMTDLYVEGKLTFKEMIFGANAVDFTHMFIFKESKNLVDREIMSSLTSPDHKEAYAGRIHDANKSAYVYETILETAQKNPDLIKFLYALFENRFDPSRNNRLSAELLAEKFKEFQKIIAVRFIDFNLGYEIFRFMFKIITSTLKTNFYKDIKRSYAFRLDNAILDPIVFSQTVYGIFYVNGHYACGTHLRAGDIARGGLRMIRVSEANHSTELDNVVMLNYALGAKAQRLKHKDICESGSKGVVVPHPSYAGCSMDALYDYTEGIMDLMLTGSQVVDYLGHPEMIFFGPDEGTAPLMDAVALRARERGYKHWRTITTGKSFGIPHDTYGMLETGDLFGLIDRNKQGTELQINGNSIVTTLDMDKIYDVIGGKIKQSGMTTTCVMGAFRTLIEHYGAKEEDLNLMITGGPDGDLGANEIQCYKGKICLIIDGGSILFDPEGLDKKELMKIAFMRHTSPRANSLAYPKEKLSKNGFMVPLRAKDITLPDGTYVEDGAIFHKSFLTNGENRKFIEQANIEAFIPCGGFKDTINHGNVHDFLDNFKELKFIVEGANVFFDDAARRHIATASKIKEIKDSTANKGGVFSSSIAEVLTAFLFNDDYETKLLEDKSTRWGLIRDIIELVAKYSRLETGMLIKIHESDLSKPLFGLSEETSEQIFTLQAIFEKNISTLLKNEELIWQIMEHYIPSMLIAKLGRENIMTLFGTPEMVAYRDTIITKKLASLAFYKYGLEWDNFVARVESDLEETITTIME